MPQLADDDRQRLSRLRPELEADGWLVPEDYEYRDQWWDALNGKFPAELDRGRWYFRRKKLPEIGKALGLRRQTVAAA